MTGRCAHDWVVWAYVAAEGRLVLAARCERCDTETRTSAPAACRVGARLPATPAGDEEEGP